MLFKEKFTDYARQTQADTTAHLEPLVQVS